MKINEQDINSLKEAATVVWEMISGDVEYVSDNAEALELCLDAGRLKRFGFIDAQNTFDRLAESLLFDEIVNELDRYVKLI